jgi:hypothetical protein
LPEQIEGKKGTTLIYKEKTNNKAYRVKGDRLLLLLRVSCPLFVISSIQFYLAPPSSRIILSVLLRSARNNIPGSADSG